MKHSLAAVAAVVVFAACGEAPTEPHAPLTAASSQDVIQQVFTSGSNVMTWNPIIPASMPSNWPTTVCTQTPAVGPNANWQNPHNAYVLAGHPWENRWFTAPWINAWNNLSSSGSGAPSPYHNWTKYETQVSGNGTFVLWLLADNCSWVYLDGTLVGFQPTGAENTGNLSYGVTLNGTHALTFVIFDGGGAAGGQFRLETTTNPPPPLNPDLDNDGHQNDVDAFPLDPAEWADSDGDGHGDNGDAYPNDPSRWEPAPDTDGDGVDDVADNCPAVANASQADTDHDGQGDACDTDDDGDGVADASDAFPLDSAESVDTDHDGIGNNADTDDDGDGVADASDAFPLNPAESVDTDHDGIGNNADTDDDNDGLSDAAEISIGTDPLNADTDGDGVRDGGDAFPRSNRSATCVIRGCDSGVANKLLPNGATFNDLLGAAYAAAGGNHGKFVSAVAALTDGWKKAGLISGRDEGAITSCAARTK